MVRLAVEEQKEYPTLPKDSILHLKVESVEQRTVAPPGREAWDKLEFKFKILGVQMVGDGGDPSRFDGLLGENIFGSTSTRITNSQENKLRLWSEAILNRPLELGFEFDSDFFIGREVRAVTSTYEKKNKNPATGLPFVAHQVDSLLPMGGGIGGGAPVAPQGYAAPAPAGNAWGQQAPAAQAPQQWTPPPAQPQADPWAAQAPPAPAGDPWAAPGVQQPAQQAPVQQPPAQQYQQPAQQPPAQQQYAEPDF